ncbi:MAG: hypothetical protein HKN24_13540 [Acidimicrobiales bacterium]|nr:hypothetical protein [Acidimicrobiales bacterium]
MTRNTVFGDSSTNLGRPTLARPLLALKSIRMRLSDSTDARPSRLALAVVLSTLSVAAIAGPLAYQALEVKNEIRVGTVNPNGPTVGGVSTVASTAALPESTSSTALVTEVEVKVEEEPEPVTDSAPVAITQSPPAVSTAAPTTAAPDNTEATLGPSVSVERTIETPEESADEPETSNLAIPSSPATQPTWVVGDTAQLPSTTVPSDDEEASIPPSTEASTSGSVTTAGPPVTEPLEPIDTTTTVEPTTTTTEPGDTVITEPLDPVDTSVPPSTEPTTTVTTVPSTTSTSSDATTTTEASAEPTAPGDG